MRMWQGLPTPYASSMGDGLVLPLPDPSPRLPANRLHGDHKVLKTIKAFEENYSSSSLRRKIGRRPAGSNRTSR